MLEALIDLTEAQIATVIARAANIDAQALGLVGFDAALLATDVAAQQLLGHLWWIPLPGLAMSIVIGSSVMAVTRFDIGPSPSSFYARHATTPHDEALVRLLSDLLASQRHNAQPLSLKTERLVLGLTVLLFTILYSVLAIAS
ncbi:MAG: hypothetical protein ABSB69_19325 [Solirubrobacteraceae bacterium]